MIKVQENFEVSIRIRYYCYKNNDMAYQSNIE